MSVSSVTFVAEPVAVTAALRFVAESVPSAVVSLAFRGRSRSVSVRAEVAVPIDELGNMTELVP